METTSIKDTATRLGMTEQEVEALVENGELIEVSAGRISKESIYAYSGLNIGGRQTANTRKKEHKVTAPKTEHKEPDFADSIKRVYTIEEASKKIGFASDSSIYHHINKGTIKRVDGGVDADDVDAFIRIRKKAPDIKPNVKPITKKEAQKLQDDLNAGRVTVKPIGDVPAEQHTPPLVDDALFAEIEEAFCKEVAPEPLYTETEVKEALKVAYRKGMESAHRHLTQGVA